MGYGHTKEYKREYYLANRERILARVQERREENLARIAEYRGRAGQRIAARAIVRKAQNRARLKGLPFDEKFVTVKLDRLRSLLRWMEECQ